jgi:drug/metabolite transporter (DMT)-like permease
MTIEAILLLALAAIVHSTWNLLSKRSLDKQVFLWAATGVELFVLAPPFLYLLLLGGERVPGIGWVFVLLSGVLEAAYVMLLGSSYQRGDLSLVYPLARGSAILFVTLFALAFLREVPSALGLTGIMLVILGIYTMHLKSLGWRGLYMPLKALRHERASQLALLTGVVIAGYSSVDKVGVSHVNPVVYLYLVFLVATLLLMPYIVIARSKAVKREWLANRRAIVAVAALSAASYLLVLFVLTTSRVSYASSVREMSVVMAALLGTFLLREPFGPTRLAGSLLIFSGIFCIALA